MADTKRRAAPKARPRLHVVAEDHAPTSEPTNSQSGTSVDCAEEWVDLWGGRLMALTHKVSRSAMRAGSRVKEEIEDVWAEARAVSRTKT